MALYYKMPPQGANKITPRPEDGGIPPILPPQPDNIAGNLTGNNKIQDLGKTLWEGEAFAEQRALKGQDSENVIAPATTALPLSGQTPSDIPPEDAFKITPRQDIDAVGMNSLIKDNLYS